MYFMLLAYPPRLRNDPVHSIVVCERSISTPIKWFDKKIPRRRAAGVKGNRDEVAAGASGLQLAYSPLQEPALGFLSCEAQGALVGGAGFLRSAQPPAQLRPRRVRQVIVVQ